MSEAIGYNKVGTDHSRIMKNCCYILEKTIA